MRRSLLLLLPFALIGCSGGGPGSGDDNRDADSDGLSDADEAAFGTDSAVADTDGDGLTDKEEFDLGTDGTVVDSDGDGYTDGDEVTAGVDPTDAASMIYAGGWPYNADKDSMADPGWDGNAEKDGQLVRFQLQDQFGEMVDIYDFANHGKPVVIDLSGEWCGWCNVMAAWVGGDVSRAQPYIDEGYDFEGYNGSQDWYDVVPQMVADGDIYWVTVLDSDWSGGKISTDEALEWEAAYPDENVPVLADTKKDFSDWVAPAGFPTLMLLDENLTITLMPSDYTRVFKAVMP